jgi:two-component system LytT family response regulator
VTLRALVVDDEPLARLRLRDLMAEVPWLECVGEAADAQAAAAAIERTDPDVLFLDVQLPGTLGTDLAARLGRRPAVIFTTAYDRYAVTAFELHALDYLLKPFGRARFRMAAERAREALAQGRPADASSEGRLERLFVRDRGRILLLPVAAIERIEAQDDYVAVHCEGRTHLVHMTLGTLEERLDPKRFVRVHRRHLVNLDFVRTLTPRPGGLLDVQVASGHVVPGSRSRARAIRRLVLTQGADRAPLA